MSSEEARSRYWARSFAGWPKFGSVQPNAAHEAIARLQHKGGQPTGWQALQGSGGAARPALPGVLPRLC